MLGSGAGWWVLVLGSGLWVLVLVQGQPWQVTAEGFVPCRYTAVAMPMLYNTRYSSKRRVTVMIAVVWVLSFAISCPLLFGLNNTGEGSATFSWLLESSWVPRNKGGISSEVYLILVLILALFHPCAVPEFRTHQS